MTKPKQKTKSLHSIPPEFYSDPEAPTNDHYEIARKIASHLVVKQFKTYESRFEVTTEGWPELVKCLKEHGGDLSFFRIEMFIDRLRECKNSVQFLDLTLEKLLAALILPPNQEWIFVDLMLKRLGMSSAKEQLAEFL